jgi:hypothetical protein
MNKKGFQFNFSWLFAIIVGAVILFLAIYIAGRFVRVGKYEIDTKTAKQLGVIFEPMTLGLESGKSNVINLREETKIYNNCQYSGNFGYQEIKLSTKQFGKWKRPGAGIEIPNKYLFSNKLEGREIRIFSIPFEFPWKISEITILTTNSYCFINPPEEIKEKIEDLNLKNIKMNNCSSGVRVCFGGGDCDINVRGLCSDCGSVYDYGIVEKEEDLFYTGNLIYGAIFSSKEVYNCNIIRLMKRLSKQASIFKGEAEFLVEKCGTVNSNSLLNMEKNAEMVGSSQDLLSIKIIAENLDKENEKEECQLW